MSATRQLASIMFTDMVGYTALMQENEQLAMKRRNRNQEIFEAALKNHEGKLLQYYGDGTMSIFTSAVNSIKCAIEMQTLCRMEKIDLRIGIHIGDVLTDANGIYGDSVNVASRLETLSVPGSIFISEKLYDDVKNHEGIAAKPMGYFELKNVKQPMQVYAISNEGLVVPSRDEVKGKVKQTLNSIAVLPFASLSSDPENEYFCDGITEELLNVLAKIDGLQVTSRTSSFAFKGRNEDVREVAAKLSVQKVLEGSVRKAGSKVRITAQLINAADGYHLWSETYDRSLEDIFAVQDEIAHEIANRFKLNLNEEDHTRELVKAPTENLEAYKKYLQGLHWYSSMSIDGIFKALAAFNEAAAMEPTFINPLVHIININAFFTHAAFITVEQGRKICTEALDKILRIDQHNPWTWLAKGLVTLYFEWDLGKAEQCWKKAFAMNPNLSNASLWLAWVYAAQGRTDEMLQVLKTAQRLDPLGGDTIAGASELCLITNQLDESAYYGNDALNQNPHNLYAACVMGLVEGFKGNWEEAVNRLQAVYKIVPDFNLAIAFYGYALARNGKRAEAEELLHLLERKQEPADAPALDPLIALLNLALGNKEAFYHHFEEGIRKKIVTSLYYFRSPLVAEVKNEERLKALLRKMNLPD